MLVSNYKKLMMDFMNEDISVDDFERDYLKMFKNETVRMDEDLFNVLNAVFEAIDCYWYECLPGQETTFEISEQQLRIEVATALKKLKEVLSNHE